MAINNTNTILLSGTIIEFQDTDGKWKHLPRVADPGASGEMAEPKEKTVIEETSKTYGVGLRDAPDKNLQGQVIPPQVVGGEYELERALQQAFFARARNEDEMPMRITYPDLQRCTITRWQALGFQIDGGTADGWKMWTVNGKQNSRPLWSEATALTSITVAPVSNITVGNSATLVVTPVPLDAYYVRTRYMTSSDEAVATVTPAGVVTGVSPGTATITIGLGNEGIETTVEVKVVA